jgi:hypothetical protein
MSLNLSSFRKSEHGVVLTQAVHLLAVTSAPGGLAALTGRVAHPYANVVGANSCDCMCDMTFAHARTTNGPKQTESSQGQQ